MFAYQTYTYGAYTYQRAMLRRCNLALTFCPDNATLKGSQETQRTELCIPHTTRITAQETTP
jgi:Pyruvate/2-oxoacid:ferredoxin oxidoreductase delta subunit